MLIIDITEKKRFPHFISHNFTYLWLKESSESPFWPKSRASSARTFKNIYTTMSVWLINTIR